MGLFNSHEHTWVVDDFDFSPPLGRSLNITVWDTAGERIYRSDTEGVTNIYLRCTKCGAIDTKTVYGKYEPKKGS